ncbi:MAG: hypothetical protein ACMV1B_02550 [Prevotella sp.]|jgi:hypothetical protein|nr:hypothetical protein [Prevotella sp.]MBP8758155.1 hypothetical protein [Prevotella sp.]MDY0154582.1 hypothetical protein [Prevotella sp.]
MHRQRLWAWMLLAVFVPMLMMSTFHRHEEVRSAGITCYDCQHHIHHAGHIANGWTSIDKCVLCHFHSLPYILGTEICLALFTVLIYQLLAFLKPMHATTFRGITTTRGPPSFYLL